MATNIKKILNDGKADVVIEATGKKNLMELAYNLTKNKGETIFCGQQRRGDFLTYGWQHHAFSVFCTIS